ncbi:MAG TPA: NUDIX domain-containing protein, partial [Hyphomicrobiaceae bacterium]|nr:NUDIX domain-containing protein [Hyphomicrobiaceae bacterium]
MSQSPDSPVREFSIADLRLRAAQRLAPEPSDAIFDPRTGQAWGRGDWDLNPELLADFAAMAPPRPAAVLVPVIAREEVTVLLTQRPEAMRQHAGQISFPGGKVEPD